MTKSELEKILENDKYFEERQHITDYDRSCLLREVDFRCPLCHKDLQRSDQTKPTRLYQIAHIFPNRPSVEQYIVLKNVKRLGNTCESNDNKIVLCLECHHKQDFQTTLNDYNTLYNIKMDLINRTKVREKIENLSIDDNIVEVINMVKELNEEEYKELKYFPVTISNKIENDLLLKTKIESYVEKYFIFIRDCLKSIDGRDGFQTEVLSYQIKACYLTLKKENSQSDIFEHMVEWLLLKTHNQSKYACEALIAYFVQNCEVFDEISK